MRRSPICFPSPARAYLPFLVPYVTLWGMAQIDSAAPARTSAVTVVIPVWNGAGVIADCLRSIYANSGDFLRGVIAVDNASPDDSAAVIEREFPQVHRVHSSFNLGFAGGVNLGVDAAFARDAELDAVVLLNQDCLVEPGWLVALCAGLSGDRPGGNRRLYAAERRWHRQSCRRTPGTAVGLFPPFDRRHGSARPHGLCNRRRLCHTPGGVADAWPT